MKRLAVILLLLAGYGGELSAQQSEREYELPELPWPPVELPDVPPDWPVDEYFNLYTLLRIVTMCDVRDDKVDQAYRKALFRQLLLEFRHRQYRYFLPNEVFNARQFMIEADSMLKAGSIGVDELADNYRFRITVDVLCDIRR